MREISYLQTTAVIYLKPLRLAQNRFVAVVIWLILNKMHSLLHGTPGFSHLRGTVRAIWCHPFLRELDFGTSPWEIRLLAMGLTSEVLKVQQGELTLLGWSPFELFPLGPGWGLLEPLELVNPNLKTAFLQAFTRRLGEAADCVCVCVCVRVCVCVCACVCAHLLWIVLFLWATALLASTLVL